MRKWWPLVAICLGAFILLVDVTIVNVALPQMAGDLHASFSSLQWVMDAYALALAALLLVTGSLADLFGHRRVYLLGLGVFALSSLACALAPNGGALIAARAVQGVGGAAMFATSAALLTAAYQGRDRGTAFGVWGAVNGAAAAAGPLLGGLLTEHLGWQAIFLVNLPIAAVAVALTLWALRADGAPHRGGPAGVDVPGALAFTVASGSLTFALIRGGEQGWTNAATLGAFALAALALVGFVAVEVRAARPMLDLALLRRPSFAGLMAGALLMQAGAFGSLALLSLWVQSVLGRSPVGGGLALLPLAGSSFLVSAFAGRHLQRVAPRWPIGGGMLLIALGMALLRLGVSAESTQSALVAGLCVAGAGVGVCTPVLVSAAMGSVPPQRTGMAGGAVNTFRQLGLTLGIAVFGAVFVDRARGVLAATPAVPDPARVAGALGAGQAQRILAAVPAAHRQAADRALHAAFAAGLDRVFLFGAGAAALGGLLVLTLVRGGTGSPGGHGRGRAEPANAPRQEQPAPTRP
jgi:EmrB/QacA subfamily drug resistance transporter